MAKDKMRQSDIIFCFFFPANQNPSKAVQPTVGSLNNPVSGLLFGVCSQLFCFITTCFYMRSIAKLLNKLPHLIEIIFLIKTQMLTVIRSCFRALHKNAGDRCPRQFHIVLVCAFNGKPKGNACPIAQHRPLYPCFTPVGGVFSCFFSRPWVLGSWLRPWISISSQYHADHHRQAVRFPKTAETPRCTPTLEIVHVLLNQSTCRWRQGLSIGNRFLAQAEYRSLRCDTVSVFSRPRWVRVYRNRQQRFDFVSQLVGYFPAGCFYLFFHLCLL